MTSNGRDIPNPKGYDPGIFKPVFIAEPETISGRAPSLTDEHTGSTQAPSPRQHRGSSFGKRLHGRASITPTASIVSLSGTARPSSQADIEQEPQTSETPQDLHGRLLAQLIKWLYEEKAKRSSTATLTVSTEGDSRQHDAVASTQGDNDFALDKLENIIKEHTAIAKEVVSKYLPERPASYFPTKKPSTKKIRKLSVVGGSSDTDYQDNDAIVPSTDVVLDNSKAMSYTSGYRNTTADTPGSSKRMLREQEGWLQFKSEIVRLAHTLRLKGWRRVPLDRGADIEVQRLSGALTNAVYVVSPPKDLPVTPSVSGPGPLASKRLPRKLLLRVYGPQVEHLIDRETELQILRRLARKKIGPRLLGTFENGRFEEYFNATTLTAEDLRNPETSKQIAKRMRELHDGIELLDSERDAGPFVWQNWDKWVARCEQVITWLDAQIIAHKGPVMSGREAWKSRGFVCGVEWIKFREAVGTYRKWLEDYYGGKGKIRSKLVFAHNDTQYGNLLRLQPSGESPLLLPANEHKQLVVIDFEYANANTRGLEFANHFTEWCYNYHNPKNPHICNTSAYPTPAEQRRFIAAYVQHVPQYGTRTPTTYASPGPGTTSSISSFMLDSRGPPAQYDAEERVREEKAQQDIDYLTTETRLWRVANSAQWVAWGIVQAKVDGMDAALEEARKHNLIDVPDEKLNLVPGNHARDENHDIDQLQDSAHEPQLPLIKTVPGDDNEPETERKDNEPEAPLDQDIEDEPGFDYLAYAQQRALFFWGDLLELGLMKAEDLPDFVVREAKRVPY